jgi:hypothetical protein
MKESEVQPKPKPHDDFADLLKGGESIAAYIGEDYRTTVYKLTTKQLPGWKVGAVWYSTKPKIRARLLGEDASNGGAADE